MMQDDDVKEIAPDDDPARSISKRLNSLNGFDNCSSV